MGLIEIQGTRDKEDKLSMHTGSTPSRVIAVLEMEQGWMSIHALMADLELRWGQVKLATVRRATHRLINQQAIESRLTDELELRAA